MELDLRVQHHDDRAVVHVGGLALILTGRRRVAQDQRTQPGREPGWVLASVVLGWRRYPLTLTSRANSFGPVSDRSLTMPIPGP